MSQTENLQNEFILEIAQIHLPRVNVFQEEFECVDGRVFQLDLPHLRLQHAPVQEGTEILGSSGQDDPVGLESLTLDQEGHVAVFVILEEGADVIG